MFKLNIQSLKILSERSGVSEEFLGNLFHNLSYKNAYVFDHSSLSRPKEDKFVRVAKKDSELYKLHRWIDSEMRKADNLLPFNIIGGVSKRYLRNAIKVHVRREPFCFLKSDLKRFFESIPEKEIFSLLCGYLNCSKDVAQVITNSITIPLGPLGSSGANFLARGLNPSSRIAIWTNIHFFRTLSIFIWNKYKKYKPIITFYVDDIGISIKTLNINVIDELKLDLENFILETNNTYKHLSINLEKTRYTLVVNDNDFVEYLGTKIFKNKVMLGDKVQDKILITRKAFLTTKDRTKKITLGNQLTGFRNFKRSINGTKKSKK